MKFDESSTAVLDHPDTAGEVMTRKKSESATRAAAPQRGRARTQPSGVRRPTGRVRGRGEVAVQETWEEPQIQVQVKRVRINGREYLNASGFAAVMGVTKSSALRWLARSWTSPDPDWLKVIRHPLTASYLVTVDDVRRLLRETT